MMRQSSRTFLRFITTTFLCVLISAVLNHKSIQVYGFEEFEVVKEVEEPSCQDEHSRCKQWANGGQCRTSPNYMSKICKLSCGTCEKQEEQNPNREQQQQQEVANDKHQHFTNEEMKKMASFGVLQKIHGIFEDGDNDEQIQKTIRVVLQSIAYMDDFSLLYDDDDFPPEGCMNVHELCAYWVGLGECENNPVFMQTGCGPSCRSCELIPQQEQQQQQERLIPQEEEEEEETTIPKYNKNENDDKLTEDEIFWMLSFGVQQTVPSNDDEKARTLHSILESITYMQQLFASGYEDLKQKCRNKEEMCAFWAGIGECDTHTKFMTESCGPSCKTCQFPHHHDHDDQEEEEDTDVVVVVPKTKAEIGIETKVFGVEQTIDNGPHEHKTKMVALATISYMNKLPKHSKEECRNEHQLCAYWAALSECSNNPAFMNTDCRPSCQSCLLDDDDDDEEHLQQQEECTFIENQKVCSTKQDLVMASKLAAQQLDYQLYVEDCSDFYDNCYQWATEGHCQSHAHFLLKNCRASCGMCVDPNDPYNEMTVLSEGDIDFLLQQSEPDEEQEQSQWNTQEDDDTQKWNNPKQQQSQNETPEEQMIRYGLLQDVNDSDTMDVVVQTLHYMKSKVFPEEHNYSLQTLLDLKKSCQNRHESCAYWTALGECEMNAEFMMENCSPTCQFCELYL